MLNPSEFFTPTNMMLCIPVLGAALVLMPLLFSGLVDSIMPWKDLQDDTDSGKVWSDAERRKVQQRRTEERMANAREAWRRGNPDASVLIGRRKSDYEALGIPFPEEAC